MGAAEGHSYKVLKQNLFNFAKEKGPAIPPSVIDTSKIMQSEAVRAYQQQVAGRGQKCLTP